MYINDLPWILERYSFPVLYTDTTSIVITVTGSTDFMSNSREIFSQWNKWCYANLCKLNYDTTNFLHFRTKNSIIWDMKLQYNNKSTNTKLDTRFLGIIMDSACTLQWKALIDSLLMKTSAACYTLRALKLIMSQKVLVMVYFSYLYLMMSYDLIFWGASPHT
jgi:hypothetical protein